MLVQPIEQARQSAHVVVLGNEKGGSGKSTTALHIAVALLKAGQRVATIDLDCRQKSFTHYIENRRAWAERARVKLELPTHYCVARGESNSLRSQRGGGVRQLLQGGQRDRAQPRRGGDRHARQRHLSDAARPFDGRHAGHAAQRQLRRFRRARHARSDQFRRHRRKPLCRDGARSAPPAPAGRRPAHRLDRGAQSSVRRSARATSGWSARA